MTGAVVRERGREKLKRCADQMQRVDHAWLRPNSNKASLKSKLKHFIQAGKFEHGAEDTVKEILFFLSCVRWYCDSVFLSVPTLISVVTQGRSPPCPGRADLLKEWVGPLLGKGFLWLLNSLGNSLLGSLILDVSGCHCYRQINFSILKMGQLNVMCLQTWWNRT